MFFVFRVNLVNKEALVLLVTEDPLDLLDPLDLVDLLERQEERYSQIQFKTYIKNCTAITYILKRLLMNQT